MKEVIRRNARTIGVAGAVVALVGTVGLAGGSVSAGGASSQGADHAVHVEMFAPEDGDRAGVGCKGWFVDLEVGFDVPLDRTGFTGLQLTGPALHNNTAPFPGTFSMGADDRFKGLIVVVSTNVAGAGTNVANLFNLTGVTDRGGDSTEIWDTWIVGSGTQFGCNTDATVYSAIAEDHNGDGIYNDAPGQVPDSDSDGDVDEDDLRTFGVASNIEDADFFITE